MRDVLIGQTDYTVLVRITGTDGAPETGLAHTDIDIAYSRVETDNDVTTSDVSPADLANLTAAHSDWGWEEVSSTDHPGLYRLDIADAVFASGAWEAVVTITDASGSDFYAHDIGFRLVSVNWQDGVRLGLTALPNAAADGAGGLPISDAGGLDLDAKIGALTYGTANRVNVQVYGMEAATITAAAVATGAIDADAIADNAIDAGAIASDAITAAKIATGAITSAKFAAGAIDATAIATNAIDADALAADAIAEINATVDTALADYDGPTYAEVRNWVAVMCRKDSAIATDLFSVISDINTDRGSGAGAFANTTDALEALRDNTGTAGAGLTSIDLPDQTMNITGNLSGSVGSVTGAVGSVTGNVGGNVTGSVGSVLGGINTTAGVITTLDGLDTAQDTQHSTTQAAVAAVQADLPQKITKNTALAAFPFTMVLASDHVTGATGLTVTATRSLDGAAFGACANSVSEVANGVYKIDLAAGDLNGNTVTLKFAAATADTRIIHLVTQPT